MTKVSMEEIVSLAKRRGFVFPGSEIYGGLAGTYDYGPLGVALKNNIKALWWKTFVTDREDMYGIDAAILMNSKAWQASGHVSGFSDPLVECLNCKKRHRVDQIVNEKDYKIALEAVKNVPVEVNDVLAHIEKQFVEKKIKYDKQEITLETLRGIVERTDDFEKYIGPNVQFFLNKFVPCPDCKQKQWSEPRTFNMMFKTKAGAADDDSAVVYLRPETAGGMFVNFKNVIDSFHPKLPFGLAQIGKAFRNEIAPRDFIFRLRELEQMEIEFFVDPRNESEVNRIFDEWFDLQIAFLTSLGLSKSKIHKIDVPAEDRAHYSKRSIDTEFDFPFGQKELLGLAYRTDFDLTAHANASGANLTYLDEETKEKIVPHCIEPTFGLDRLVLAVLSDAYAEDEQGGEKRVYLKLSPKVAPYTAAVFPLLKNKPELVAKAREVFHGLKKAGITTAFDDNGNIGKRYRRQDEIGTPFCITIDFDTLGENPELLGTVTLRHRDSGEQERLSIEDVKKRIAEALA